MVKLLCAEPRRVMCCSLSQMPTSGHIVDVTLVDQRSYVALGRRASHDSGRIRILLSVLTLA